MNRKLLSLIIIISTEICVIIMLGVNCNFNQKDIFTYFYIDRIFSLNVKKNFHNVKEYKINSYINNFKFNIDKNKAKIENNNKKYEQINKMENINNEISDSIKSVNKDLNKVSNNEMISNKVIIKVDKNELHQKEVITNKSNEYYNMKRELIRERINEDRINYYDNKDYYHNRELAEEDKSRNIDNKREIPVFKVATYEIKKNLTMSDKRKLLKVATKLNIKDYTKIKDFLYADNQKEGILNAIYLLEERLDEDDYQNVREIADRFVDMDTVEKNKKSWAENVQR